MIQIWNVLECLESIKVFGSVVPAVCFDYCAYCHISDLRSIQTLKKKNHPCINLCMFVSALLVTGSVAVCFLIEPQ